MFKRFILVVTVIGVLLGVLPLPVLQSIGIPDIIPVAVAANFSNTCPYPRCRPLVEGIQPSPPFFKRGHCSSCHYPPLVIS